MMKPVHIRVTRLGTPEALAGMLGQMKEAGAVHDPFNEIPHAIKTHVNGLPHSTIKMTPSTRRKRKELR